jgi:hypothetical protein
MPKEFLEIMKDQFAISEKNSTRREAGRSRKNSRVSVA